MLPVQMMALMGVYTYQHWRNQPIFMMVARIGVMQMSSIYNLERTSPKGRIVVIVDKANLPLSGYDTIVTQDLHV